MTPIPSSPVQAQRGTDERERLIAHAYQIGDEFSVTAADMLRADAEQLRARDEEIAGLRADALRYRWIRGNEHMDIAACWLITAKTPYAPQTAEELDAAIDAALQEKSRDAR